MTIKKVETSSSTEDLGITKASNQSGSRSDNSTKKMVLKFAAQVEKAMAPKAMVVEPKKETKKARVARERSETVTKLQFQK